MWVRDRHTLTTCLLKIVKRVKPYVVDLCCFLPGCPLYMYKYKWYTIIHAHSDALQSLSCGHSGCLLSDFTFTHLALSLT